MSDKLKTHSEEKIFDVVKYFIKKAKQNSKELTNKKLQKLLYYAQAWNYTLRGSKIFNDEIEAWIHGPAIPKIYDEFMKYGRENFVDHYSYDELSISKLDEVEIQLLDGVWAIYGKYTGEDLEILTHEEDPWQKAREGSEPYESSNNIISLESMKKYYGSKR